MGLKSSFEFLNQLRMGDLRTTFEGGDDAALALIPTNEKASVEEFQRMLACVSPHHILKLFAPEKLDAITNILDGIESLADFNQRLNKHMAAQAALEPIHSVLCDMLRSGMDFGAAAERCPLAIATEAMRHQCSTPDDDAVTFAKAAPGNRTRSSPGAQNSGNQRRRGPRNNQPNRTPSNSGARNKIKNCCFFFPKRFL